MSKSRKLHPKEGAETVAAAEPSVPLTDGRRRRSERSRNSIVTAMAELIGEGNVAPSAADVAARAGVGLRSVFRHFDDMDAIYRDIMEGFEEEILPQVTFPPAGETWAERGDQLLKRRTAIYERILPYKVSAGIRRYGSAFLAEGHERFRKFERLALEAALPVEYSSNPVRLAAIEAAFSFDVWRRMREDQGMSVEESAAALADILHTLAPG